jgi:hypothetical protein
MDPNLQNIILLEAVVAGIQLEVQLVDKVELVVEGLVLKVVYQVQQGKQILVEEAEVLAQCLVQVVALEL